MEAVFVGSVGWTWNLTISSAGSKEVDLDHLSSITSSLSTLERSAVSSLAARALENASRASAAVFFGAECYVRITDESDYTVWSGHFELHISVVRYSLEACESIPPQ